MIPVALRTVAGVILTVRTELAAPTTTLEEVRVTVNDAGTKLLN
jgi:hypothetical protein